MEDASNESRRVFNPSHLNRTLTDNKRNEI